MKTEKSLMSKMRDAMDLMTIGEEWVYDCSNRNFTSLRNTFQALKNEDVSKRTKQFKGSINDDKTLFTISRTA